MKKIKYIAPILGVVATAGAITPILTSCSNANVNKVVLQDNQKAERTVTGNSGTLAFYFKQENPKNPENTKVYLKDFAINGLSGLKAPDKTIRYVADSAGNMRVTVDVRSIVASWSDVETISITLTFKNKKAGTKYDFGPLTINVVSKEQAEAGEAEAEDATEPIVIDESISDHISIKSYTPSFDNTCYLCKIEISDWDWENPTYMPQTIVVTDTTTQKALTPGEDYIYYIDADEGGCIVGGIWIPNVSDRKLNVKLELSQNMTYSDMAPFNTEDNYEVVNYIYTISSFNDGFTLDCGNIKTVSSGQIWVKEYKYDNTGALITDEVNVNLNLSTPEEEMQAVLDKVFGTLAAWYADDGSNGVDKTKSVILMGFDIKGTDASSNPAEYFGSCGFKAYKESEDGGNTEVDFDDEGEDAGE